MQTDKPLISIIVPVFCAEQYLSTCLDSLLLQTYENLEILLIDDGSTDSSGVICNQYAQKDMRIKVLHQSNRGVSAARNLGVELAKGIYIAHIDADDWIAPDYICYLVRLSMEFQAEISLCGCKLPKEYEVKTYFAEDALKAMLYQKEFDTSLWGKLFHREIAKGISFPDGMFFEDLAVVCQMFGEAKRIVCGKWQGYHYRRTPDGTMNGGHTERLLDELQAANLMEEYIAKQYPALTEAARCRKFSAYCQVLMKLPGRGYAQERNEIWRFIRENRPLLLKDGNARRKNRIAAAVSCFGEDIMRAFWKRQMQ